MADADIIKALKENVALFVPDLFANVKKIVYVCPL